MPKAARDEAVIVRAVAGASPPARISYCSFCFKSQREVRRLISGPAAIFIRSECIDLRNQYIADRPTNSSKNPLPRSCRRNACWSAFGQSRRPSKARVTNSNRWSSFFDLAK